MNYQQKLQNLRKEIIAKLTSITDRPEGWLPHTVYVEQEGADNQGRGIPVYTEYKLLNYFPDGECELLNVALNEVEPGGLCEIEIEWLITVLNYYGELTGERIEDDPQKELRAFTFSTELRNITDDELRSRWRNNDPQIKSYLPSGFAALLNDELFDEQNYYVRFLEV